MEKSNECGSLYGWAVWESAMDDLEDTEARCTNNGAESEPGSVDMTWSVQKVFEWSAGVNTNNTHMCG